MLTSLRLARRPTRHHANQNGASTDVLSVVIPVFNGAATIGSLVDALVTANPGFHLQIILVNDGSADASGQAAGLEVVELSYRHVGALSWAVVSRGLGKLRERRDQRAKPTRSDLRPLPAWLNAALEIGSRAENAWLRVARLPPGLSVWCVARRPVAGQAPRCAA